MQAKLKRLQAAFESKHALKQAPKETVVPSPVLDHSEDEEKDGDEDDEDAGAGDEGQRREEGPSDEQIWERLHGRAAVERRDAENEAGGGGEGGGAGPEVQALLEQWVSAKRQKDFDTADRLREQLRARGIEPDRQMMQRERPKKKKKRKAGAEAAQGGRGEAQGGAKPRKVAKMGGKARPYVGLPKDSQRNSTTGLARKRGTRVTNGRRTKVVTEHS